jgi:hypothetical protein
MNALEVRRAVDATVAPLSDITRAGVWQRIERELETAPPRARTLSLRMAVLSVSAVAVLALVAYISLRASAPSLAPSSSHGTALAFDAGVHSQRWESDVLDIHGPAELRLERHLVVRILHVSAGTLRVHHTGAPLIVSTPSSTTWVSGPVFAVRVHGQVTEIASGAQAAQALVERSDLTLAPTPPSALGSAASLPRAADPSAAVPPAAARRSMPGTGPETGSGSSSGTGMGWGTGSGSGLGTGSGTGTGTATGTGTGNRHGTGSGSETETKSETGSETKSETGSRSGSETKSETETGSESETGSETKTGSETESETGSETESGAAKTYALAEAAMRAGETARAERLLVQILDEHTGTRLAAAAQLDLARLAFERRDYTRAHTLVDRLLAARVDANLERPAQRLRCKILVAQGKDCPAS